MKRKPDKTAVTMKIGICGNIPLDLLAVELDKLMPENEIIVGSAGAFRKELAAPWGDCLSLDACIIALDWRAMVTELYTFGYGDDSGPLISRFKKICDELRQRIEGFRTVGRAKVLLFSPISDWNGPEGFITRLITLSRFDIFRDCQNAFNDLCRSLVDVYPVDMEEISGRIGKDNAFDPRMRQQTGYPYSPVFTKSLADHLSAMCMQFRKYPLKCLVLDLDDTLWGGVVGETGFKNLVLGDSGEGSAYKHFQEEIVKLYKQGVLLAICSKNNTCDALEVLELHPHMLIRPHMITCYRINWDDKPKNIIGISSELNIGLDAMMFIDDNPAERDMMRATLPEVEILDLPPDPAYYAEALKKCTRFWPLQITRNDTEKTKCFAQERLRKESRELSSSVEKYLASLEINVTIAQADEASLPRITQLFNKTNQFNLTTKRYSQSELEKIIRDESNHLFFMGMADKFGDYGIIASSLIVNDTIDSFVLSCRAFGRQVESAFLISLLRILKERGLKRVWGHYIPSEKNSMVKDFYAKMGFAEVKAAEGRPQWQIDLKNDLKKRPCWITVNEATETRDHVMGLNASIPKTLKGTDHL